LLRKLRLGKPHRGEGGLVEKNRSLSAALQKRQR
jgi:hypothetical protein